MKNKGADKAGLLISQLLIVDTDGKFTAGVTAISAKPDKGCDLLTTIVLSYSPPPPRNRGGGLGGYTLDCV
jgi:hypothetical protein